MLFSAVQDFFVQHGFKRTYWIAYSGGLDSHVLLSLCAELRTYFPITFRTIHINHGLSANASKWALHCAEICKQYGMDYREHTVQIDGEVGDSLEEIARDKRYAVFAGYLQTDDILLTAHHQDDQAETVLLQLFRGAGPKGLAAMPMVKSFAKGWHARPLLHFSRASLQNYADLHQLRWIDDESNQNIQLTRNFIRHEILTLLKTRWPSISNTLSRSAMHCAEAQALLEEFALDDWQNAQGSTKNTLSVAKLLSLAVAKQRLLLRTWIKQLGFPLPHAKKIETIRKDVLTAAWDSTPCVAWANTELRRYRDDLYLMPTLPPHDAEQVLTWDLTQPFSLPSIGKLHATKKQGVGLRSDLQQVLIQFRQGGETVYLSNRKHHPLKNLFQEWGVPPWLRDRIPLIFVKDQLIAVTGYFLDKEYAVKENEEGWELVVEPLS